MEHHKKSVTLVLQEMYHKKEHCMACVSSDVIDYRQILVTSNCRFVCSSRTLFLYSVHVQVINLKKSMVGTYENSIVSIQYKHLYS